MVENTEEVDGGRGELIVTNGTTENSNGLIINSTVVPDDREELLGHDDQIFALKAETSDQVLNSLGTFNPYILMIFFLMACVSALAAMPVMTSAWIIGHVCGQNATNCTSTPGSVIDDFNLTGEETKYGDYTTMAFLSGNAIGGSLVNRFSDLKGRRTALLVVLTSYGVFGVASSFSRTIWQLIVLRLLHGIFFTGCAIINWVLAYESSPMGLRKYAPVVFGITWVIGYLLLAPIAYFFPHWRMILVAASLPSVIFAAILFFVLPNSFHWLVNEEREDELQRWLKAANRFTGHQNLNAAKIIRDHHRLKHSKTTTPKLGILRELMQRRVLLVYTLILAYLWTVDSFVYFGLSLFSTELAGNKYTNYVLSGVVEIPTCFLGPILLHYFGRKPLVSGSHFLTAISFFGIMCVDNSTVSLVLWYIGKFSVSCAYGALFVYASEVFPTTLRNGCMGICVFLAKFGSIFAPLIRNLSNIWILFPAFIFALLSAIAGLATLILIETKGRELPDTTSEIDDNER
ncbi:putative transporter [Aphelenchoides besseyi]|nr:putative transporter [Aphelenchoides besseyi]KAI6224086.1 putative transporter [Aphelenchoides besseyi]